MFLFTHQITLNPTKIKMFFLTHQIKNDFKKIKKYIFIFCFQYKSSQCEWITHFFVFKKKINSRADKPSKYALGEALATSCVLSLRSNSNGWVICDVELQLVVCWCGVQIGLLGRDTDVEPNSSGPDNIVVPFAVRSI